MKSTIISISFKNIIFVLLGCFFVAVALAAEAGGLTGEADKKYSQGDYREAFELYKTALLQKKYAGADVASNISKAVDALDILDAENEFDSFIEKVVEVRSDDWRVYKAAAVQYRKIVKHGYIVAGEFSRGDHRGGQGRFVDSSERDRVRALQLLQKAYALTKRGSQTDSQDTKSVLYEMSMIIMLNRYEHNAWKLQHLTDLDQLPDYEDYRYGDYSHRGAPVDDKGNPVFYSIPKSFEAAANDGERWRYLLNEIASYSENDKENSQWQWAEFLWGQFGVHTVADTPGIYRQDMDEDAEREKNIFRLDTLNDNETIARLANGIQRFTLPDEHNAIQIYQKLSGTERYGATSMGRLATIYENRRQLKTAASYLKRAIKHLDKPHEEWQDRLDQITGAWARFEPRKMMASDNEGNSSGNSEDDSVYLRFRNASSVKLTLYELKADQFLADMKAHLAADPKTLDWQILRLQNIGHQIINEGQKQYRGARLKTWTQKLQPSSDHYDRREQIVLPDDITGPYLLQASVAGGNTSFIVVWNAEAVIVKKPLEKGQLYFVVDALTGQPKARTTLHFFGYRGRWHDHDDNPRTRSQYQVETKTLEVSTDQKGLVELNRRKLDDDYQWLVHTDSGQKGFAYLGFDGIWYGTFPAPEDDLAKAYAITSQPVYRPGQQINFKIWVRQAKYDQADRSVYANKKFDVLIYSPKGEEVLNKSFTTDEYGGLDGEVTLDASATLGQYGIEVKGTSGGGYFRLEEYKKPEFEVTVEAPSEPVRLGEKFRATVKANYLFGAPVAEATVKYKVMRYDHSARWFPPMPWDWLYGQGYWWSAYDAQWYPGWQSWGISAPEKSWWGPSYDPPELVMENEAVVGADGTVEISIDTQAAKLLHGGTDHRYEIIAEVTDQSRRTITGKGEVLAARKPFQVYAWVDRGYYQTGEVVKASFTARTLDQKPVSGKGEARLYRIHYDKNNDVTETLEQSWYLNPGEDGKAELTFNAGKPGQHRLVYVLKDAHENEVEGGYVFNVIGDARQIVDGSYRFHELEIIPDKKHYSPGEKVRLMINSSNTDANILLFLRPQGGIYGNRKQIDLEGKNTVIEIDVTTADMPNFFVEAVTVINGEVYTEVKEIIVPPGQRVLNVDLMPNKVEFLPGEKASLEVKVTDAQGKPFIGSTVLAVYDKALEYISGGSNVQDIKEFFWKWRRHHNPHTEHSVQHYFGNLHRQDEKTLEPIGVFGDRVTDESNDVAEYDVVEEVAVVGFRASVAEAPMVAREAESAMDMVARPDIAMQKSIDSGLEAPANDLPNATVQIRKDFADTAFWKADITTNKDGIARVEFPMPENLTSWKASVWAMGHGTKVGQADINLITSKNILLRLQAPRFFVETDEVVLSANVHNYLENAERVKASIQLEGDNLELLGDASREINIAPNGERRVDWRVKVRREGEATIRMLAVGENESDAMEMKFPVYVHGMRKTESFSGTLSKVQNQGVIEFTVPADRRPEETRFELRYSPTLAGALVDALPYLVSYPYGCTEQTLNRFLPTVMVQNVLKQTGVDLKAIQQKQTNLNAQEIGDNTERAQQWRRQNWREHNPVFDEQEVGEMVQAGLERLYSMQLSDGGWGWFSGWGETSQAHMTAHVVHGLQVAKQNGLEINDEVYQWGTNWLRYHQAQEVQKLKNAQSKTQPYKDQADNIDAFVTMVLATENVTENNTKEMLDYLYRDRQHLSVYGKTLLALTLDIANRTSERDQVRSNIEQFLVQDDENQTAYLDLKNSSYWWYWYGNEIEAHAFYLKLLSRIDPESAIAPRLVKYLLNNRKHATYWNSTRDTALVIEAMAEYLIASGESSPNYSLDVVLDGKKIKTVELNKENLFSFDNKLVLEANELEAGPHKLELIKKGEGPLYYNAYLENFTLEDFITEAGLEVKVERRFYKLEPEENTALVRGSGGQAVDQSVEKYHRIPIAPDHQLKSGDLVEIELILESKNDYEYILIEDMKAAGFEPVEVRSGYNGNELGAYVEYRDNRVAFFVSRLARGRHSVSYRLKAEIPGSFSALPAKVEAMYAPEVRANSDEGKLSIVD